MGDLRAEVWNRPGASTFEKIYADALTDRLSGTVRANGIGDGQFEFPDFDDAETLADLLLEADDAALASAKRALIRIYDSTQTYPPVHEWRVDAVVPPGVDNNPRWQVSGTDLLDLLNDCQVYPWDWDGTTPFTSRFPDWIWGGRNILGDLRGSFQPEVVVFTMSDDVDDGTFTISVSTAGGSDTTVAIDYDATSLAVYNALLATSEIDALEVDGEAGGPWTVTILEPEVPIALSTNNGSLIGVWTLTIDATGGTYTLTADGQTTGNLNYNDAAATVEAALEALSSITACTVTGTYNGGFTITFETPDSATMSVTDSTTGGTGATLTQATPAVTATVQTQGVTLPSGWASSEFSPTDIEHGTLQSLRMWVNDGFDPALPAGATTAIAFNGREPYFPGIEKPVRVQPGGIYQISVYLYARDTDTDVRVVMRDFADNAAGTNYSTDVTLTADTWTEVTITDFQPFDDVEEIKYRIAHVGADGVDPPIIYVALPKLQEGLAATSIGGVFVALHDDATSDHTGDGRLVWEDEANPGTPYLTLDFTDSVDSNGDSWDSSDIELTAKRGWPLTRVLREAQNLGYEARVVADPITDGAWLFQLYNPEGMDDDYSASNTVGIFAGLDVVRRQTKRFRPGGTAQTVEGAERQFAFAVNTTAETALGRVETYLPDRDLNGITEISTAASTLLAEGLKRAISKTLTVRPGADGPLPLVAYRPGDTIPIVDPPAADTTDRVASISYVATPALSPTFEVSLAAERLVGSAAIRAGVIQYLREQKEIREEPPNDAAASPYLIGNVSQVGQTLNPSTATLGTNVTSGVITNSTTISATLPSSMNVGDLCLIYFTTASDTIEEADVDSTNWTRLWNVTANMGTDYAFCFGKIIEASDLAAGTFDASGLNSAFDATWIAHYIAAGSTPLSLDDLIISGPVGMDTAEHDPPAVTVPNAGTYFTFVAFHSNKGDFPTDAATDGPTGYDVEESLNTGGLLTPAMSLWSATKSISSSEDPSEIGWSDTAGSRTYATATLAFPVTAVTPDPTSGTATILSGNTSVTVTHSLGQTPTAPLVTPQADPGDDWWVSNIGDTTFDINVGTAVGSDIVFGWVAYP